MERLASFYRGKMLLITGGGGFIGSHLAEKLVALGASVRILDNFSCGNRENLKRVNNSVELIEGDVRSSSDCAKASRKCSLIFHLAGLSSVTGSMKEPGDTIAVNVAGAATLLEAAIKEDVQRVVYASSASVYGDWPKTPVTEEQVGNVMSIYAASKKLLEDTCDIYSRLYGIETIGLRYFNAYGPRMKFSGLEAPVVARFIAAIRDNQEPVIYGDGKQIRDMIFVDDIVEATLCAGAAPSNATNDKYNIATGRGVSVQEILGLVSRLLGRKVEASYQPSRQGEIVTSIASTDKAVQKLGFRAKTTLKEGLAETLQFYGLKTIGHESVL
jgi:nucleoside-diphosphate-sugar epimerase